MWQSQMNKRKFEPCVSLMIDSGAYSAWSHNSSIDLKAYIKFLKSNKGKFFSHVALDVLAQGFEKERTPESIEACAVQSCKNFHIMRDAGLDSIPVFHQGDDFKWLHQYLTQGVPFIGISCRKDLWAKEQQTWMDEVFSILTTKDGRPIVKTHGFGITKVRFMLRYPWTTVDSTSWALMAAFGQIFIPQPNPDGTPNYATEPMSIAVSGRYSKTLNKRQLEGWENQGMSLTVKYIYNYIENVLGITATEIRESPDHRRRACLMYYSELAKHIKDIRFPAKSSNLLSFGTLNNPRAIKNDPFRIMFATGVRQHGWSHIMNDLGIDTRLLSYYELRDLRQDELTEYLNTGTLRDHKERKAPRNIRSQAYKSWRAIKTDERLSE